MDSQADVGTAPQLSRLEGLSARLLRQAVVALKRRRWRIEVWHAYYSEIAPAAVRLTERADKLATLLGDVPEKVPEQARVRYRRAIYRVAESPLSDAELKQHLSTAQEAKGVYRRALGIPASIREPLMTIAAIQKMAALDVQVLYGSMPEIEATTKATRQRFYEERDAANHEAAQEADRKKRYYNALAGPYWEADRRRSKSWVADRIVRDHKNRIRDELGEDPKVKYIRQILDKPST